MLPVGTGVRLVTASSELLAGLPAEDQQAILGVVGTTLSVTGHDAHGNVELEFSDPAGVMHWIYVRPSEVATV